MDQKLLELLKTLKFRKSLIPRPQKLPKIAQKRDRSIAICSNFCIGMVCIAIHILNPHVQALHKVHAKGG